MNSLEIKGDWNITKRRHTDDVLQCVEGRKEELTGRNQKGSGETRVVIEKVVGESCSSCRCD